MSTEKKETKTDDTLIEVPQAKKTTSKTKKPEPMPEIKTKSFGRNQFDWKLVFENHTEKQEAAILPGLGVMLQTTNLVSKQFTQVFIPGARIVEGINAKKEVVRVTIAK